MLTGRGLHNIHLLCCVDNTSDVLGGSNHQLQNLPVLPWWPTSVCHVGEPITVHLLHLSSTDADRWCLYLCLSIINNQLLGFSDEIVLCAPLCRTADFLPIRTLIFAYNACVWSKKLYITSLWCCKTFHLHQKIAASEILPLCHIVF